MTDEQILILYGQGLDTPVRKSHWEIYRDVWVHRGKPMSEIVKLYKAEYGGTQ